MIFPLILLVLGVGAFATYEFSPAAHRWVDEHTRTLADAMHAHRIADASLRAGDPAQALAAATVAAQKATQSVQSAQTTTQHAIATWTGALSLAMQDQIRAFMALGIANNKLLQAPGAQGGEYAYRLMDREAAQKAYDDATTRVVRAKLMLAGFGVQTS